LFKDEPLLLRSTFIYAPAILLTRISALVLMVVATRLIDQTEYGLLTLVATIGEMTDIAVTNWLRIALLRLGGKGDVSRGSLMRAGQLLFVTTVLAVFISFAVSAVVVPERWLDFSIAVCGYLIAGAVGRFALTVLQMQQRHSTYALLEFLRAVLQLGLPVAAIFVFHGSFLTVSLGSSLGVLLAGIIAGYVAAHGVVAGPARFTHREFFALGIPLIIMALVGFGLNSAERVFLKIYADAGAVAIFAAAYALARQPIDMVANAINIGAFPEVVSRFDVEGPDAAARFLSELMALMMRLCLPVAALLMALSNDITRLVLPGEYHGQVDRLFPIIVLSVLCTNLTSFVYGSVMHAHKRPWLLIIADGCGSLGTIVLSLVLIPPLAEIGAARALAGGTIMSLIVCVIISHRLTPVPLPWRSICVSVAISVGVGAAASFTSWALHDCAAIIKLAAGGSVGGLVFLLLNATIYPDATARIVGKLTMRRASIGAASDGNGKTRKDR
jgi:O-antigen/teichoic acid export membrane protein